jgi:hypothetical protein
MEASELYLALGIVAKANKPFKLRKIIQNYWGFGLFPSSDILENRKTAFRKLDLIPSSGEGEKTPTSRKP